MQELIPISQQKIGQEEVPTVNARELWEKLEVQTPFHIWISRRIEEAHLIVNQDFVSFEQICSKPQGGRPTKEYHLSLDAGKHIAMLEGTEKGREIRQYFIDVEKQARQTYQAIQTSSYDLLSQAKLLVQSIERQCQIEQEQKKIVGEQTRQATKLQEIESKQDAQLKQTDYYCVLAYARNHGIKLPLEFAAKMGKLCADLSRQTGTPIGSVPDPRYGRVGTYHISILDAIFEKFVDGMNEVEPSWS